MITLEEFCEFARIDNAEDEQTITQILMSAELLIKFMSGKVRPINGSSSLYDTAVKMLASYWYDNRTLSSMEIKNMPFGIYEIISHIAICEYYPNFDDEDIKNESN